MRSSELAGRALRDLVLPHDALIVMVARGSERLIARGDTRLAIGDLVTLVGTQPALEQATQVHIRPLYHAPDRHLHQADRNDSSDQRKQYAPNAEQL